MLMQHQGLKLVEARVKQAQGCLHSPTETGSVGVQQNGSSKVSSKPIFDLFTSPCRAIIVAM